MRHSPERLTDAVDRPVTDIRRKTLRCYSSEDKCASSLPHFVAWHDCRAPYSTSAACQNRSEITQLAF